MRDITSIGEALIHLTRAEEDGSGLPMYLAAPGGSPAGVAAFAAGLGARTAFIGKVGPDPFGEQLRKALRDRGVDDRGLMTGRMPTTLSLGFLDSGGRRRTLYFRGADRELSPDEVEEAMVEGSKVLHFGSVSLTPGRTRSAAVFAARHAHHSGVLVSFAPGYREQVWRDRSQAEQWIRMVLPLVDILKLSGGELALAAGTWDPEEGCARLEREGISLILVMLEGGRVFCRWRGQSFLVRLPRGASGDPAGGGDAFLGAVLALLCRRGERPLEGLEREELERLVAQACRSAASEAQPAGPGFPVAAGEKSGDLAQANYPEGST